MKELIDIYDANQRRTGSIERKTAHSKGAWHKTFHCWIVTTVNKTNCLVFQLRSAGSFLPNLLDVSSAGHFKAGEKKSGIIREIKEELSIPLKLRDLHYLGQRIEVIDYEKVKNREFQDVFLTHVPDFTDKTSPDVNEVEGVFWLPVTECIELFSGQRKLVTASGRVFDKKKNQWIDKTDKVSIRRFVPRINNYYLTISIMAERLMRKEMPLSI